MVRHGPADGQIDARSPRLHARSQAASPATRQASSGPPRYRGAVTAATDVTMYSTVWCGYCARLKAQMAREGITFVEIDIEADPQAAALVEDVNHGNQTVPDAAVPRRHLATNPSIGQVKERSAARSRRPAPSPRERSRPVPRQLRSVPALDQPPGDRHRRRQPHLALAARRRELVAGEPAGLDDLVAVDLDPRVVGPGVVAEHERAGERPRLAAQVADVVRAVGDRRRPTPRAPRAARRPRPTPPTRRSPRAWRTSPPPSGPAAPAARGRRGRCTRTMTAGSVRGKCSRAVDRAAPRPAGRIELGLGAAARAAHVGAQPVVERDGRDHQPGIAGAERGADLPQVGPALDVREPGRARRSTRRPRRRRPAG